jgi:transcription elongation factor GreB
MSRAFVCDDQYDSSDDEAPELKVPIPPGSRNYLTPEGARRLADELRELETGGRPKLAAEIERLGKAGAANSAGAFSNARRALGRVDRRIEYLSRMASIAETVEPPENGYGRVKFGAAVTIMDSDGSEHGYRIVGVDEADPERGLLGWTSPLARAMMGRKPGDSATAVLPGGERRFVIKSVR